MLVLLTKQKLTNKQVLLNITVRVIWALEARIGCNWSKAY